MHVHDDAVLGDLGDDAPRRLRHVWEALAQEGVQSIRGENRRLHWRLQIGTVGDAIMKLFVLDIGIDGTSIRRRLRIPADLTLDDLHVVIQAALGWHEEYAHRFKLGGRTAKALEEIFTGPDVSVGYMYDERYAVTVTSVAVELGGARSNEDFECLSGDATADIGAITARLRTAFVTVAYHADKEPTFKGWGNRDEVPLFDHAVQIFLRRREPEQPAPVLRERARIQSHMEELLATPSMTILRDCLTRLQQQGLTRSDALDALVALAASFPGDDGNVREQQAFLMAVKQLNADSRLPSGPSAVIAAQLALKGQRDRNKRRRKRR